MGGYFTFSSVDHFDELSNFEGEEKVFIVEQGGKEFFGFVDGIGRMTFEN